MRHSNAFRLLVDEEDDNEDVVDITENRKKVIHTLTEIDISKIPSSIIAGLKPSNADNALLRAEELQPVNASEIWILKCPANAQLGELLQDKKIYLDSRQQIFPSNEDDDKKFEVVCIPQNEESPEGGTAVLPDESGKMQIVSFPVAGQIIIKAALEETAEAVPIPTPKKVHQLFSGVKVRHPIYGVDYENIIVDLPVQNHKHKKRKSKVQHEVEIEVVPVEDEEAPPKKQKKKKSYVEEEKPEIEEIEELPRKKRKKGKLIVQEEEEEPQSKSHKKQKSSIKFEPEEILVESPPRKKQKKNR